MAVVIASAAFISHSQGDGHDHAATMGSQDMGPTKTFGLHLCAFHVSKQNPSFFLEAHHYCQPGESGRFHQCIIYDKPNNGKIIGVEYIISNDEYMKLADDEKKYWHPHAYEIMSGELVAPGLTTEQQDNLFGGLIETWGKTWHTWPDPSTDMPTGEPILMWSSGGAGQISKEMIDKRDASYGINTAEIGKHRQEKFGKPVPNVAAPATMDEHGKMW